MGIFLAMALRNLLRNLSRSLIMIGGISIGLFGLLVYYGISNGFLNEMVDVAIELELSHIQITQQGYHKNPVQSRSFSPDSSLLLHLEQTEGVEAMAGRMKAAVLVNSAEKSNLVDLVGINPQREPGVTSVSSWIEEGEYLQPGDESKVVIGRKLADHLRVGLGDKLVVMTQDRHNDLQSRMFRVGGIFKCNSPMFEKSAAFVNIGTLQELLGRPGEYNAILVKSTDNKIGRAHV